MELKKCPKCNSDLKYRIEQVGADIQNNPVCNRYAYCDKCMSKYNLDYINKESAYSNNKKSGLGIAGMIIGIIALLLSCILLGGLFGVVGLVISVVAIGNKDKKHSMTIFGIALNSIALLISVIMFFVIITSEDDTISSDIENSISSESIEMVKETPKPTNTPKPTTKPTERPTEEPTPEPTETPIPKLSKDEYISQCEEISYKSLMRTPEDYIGKKIVLTIKIKQIIQGGWFDSNQYYRVQTNDEYDWWMGDEFFMYDSRIDDEMKILEDDIIKVYGEFVGLETVTRALTNTKEEVPAFEAVYIELISE